MKITVLMRSLATFFLFGLIQTAFGQRIDAAYDVANFGLIKPGFSKQALHFGDLEEKALLVLGKPDSITNFYFEMDDDTARVYHYAQNRIYFLDSKLESYHLNDASITVGQPKGLSFKIGDRFESGVNPNFKGFLVRYETGTFSEVNRPDIAYQAVGTISLKKDNIPVDAWITLLFNEEKQLVDILVVEP